MENAIKSVEKEFFNWLSSSIPDKIGVDAKNTYKTISKMLLQKKILSRSLFEITQIEMVENALRLSKKSFIGRKIRGNIIKYLNYYIKYLKEKSNLIETAVDSQENIKDDWIFFDLFNANEFERTFPAYCMLGGVKLSGNTWAKVFVSITEIELKKANKALIELYEQPLVHSRKNVPFFLKKKIEGLNCSKLSNGYWINVNYSIPRLMELIFKFCIHCGYDKSQIVLYGVRKTESDMRATTTTLPQKTSNGVDIVKTEAYLKTRGLKGCTIQELIDNVQPGAAVSSTKNDIETSLSIIEMPNGRYVHSDSFIDIDEAEECMKRILKMHFSQFGGYSNNKLLFGAASRDLSMFLNDNDCEDKDSVYALAKFFFYKKENCEKYTFVYPHIFEKKPDHPTTLKGLMINLSRTNEGILDAEEATTYLTKTLLVYGSLNQLLEISSSDTFLQYDSNRYLLTEKLRIDLKWKENMHNKLELLFKQENVAYIILRDISQSWLDLLPALPHGLKWTILLLQDVLEKFLDIGFRPIAAELNQAIDTIAAAIVPTDSALQSFADVVTLFMKEHHSLPLRMTCEELRMELKSAGMLEGNELIYALPKALDDYRFSWTDANKTVLVRDF